MSEFSFPPNTTATHNNNNNSGSSSKKTNLFSLILSDLFLFCSFIISHPLYFSYFIFFSPYIIKILSFLSPLFITTSLLLLALFTTFVIDDDAASNCCTDDQSSEKSKPSFLLSAYRNAVDNKLLRSHADDENGVHSVNFEDLEVYYKIVFDISSSNIEIIEDQENESTISEALIDKHMCHESSQLTPEVKSSEGFLKEEEEDGDDFVDVSCKGSEKQGKPLNGDELKKVDEEQELELLIGTSESKGMSQMRVSSKRTGGADDDHLDGEFYDSETSYEPSLGSYGSMRKEKEWRRTLACKLFEERHNQSNAEGTEGMDMLWETYEADSNKKQQQQQLLAKSKTKKGKKCSRKYKHNDGDGEEEEEEDDDDEEGIDDGRLCCLQALKFSAGKMNLGMGRPNLVKISKAFKGIGWLHNVTKHGKKISH